MQDFYKKALKALLLLLAVDALVTCLCVYQSYLYAPLLPAQASALPWQLTPLTDQHEGGTSVMRMHDARQRLDFDFRITDAWGHGYASANLFFHDWKNQPALVDLTKYDAVDVVAKCSPANSLMLVIPTFDEHYSKRGDLLTYPTPVTFFPCSENGMRSTISLSRLNIPQWWFDLMKLDVTHQSYRLDHVPKITIGTSSQSPHNIDSHVEISTLTLSGRDYRYIEALAAFVLLSSIGFATWFFVSYTRALTASLNARMKRDLPLVAYRQLTLEPYRDKEKAAVLRYIATNYTNTELDLETVVSETGANRNKVNEVLKAELGLTFSSYLNKLRLTEAARLLAERRNATVGEIAYSVGYSNISYFNKLFKDEYGCPPKVFRSLAPQAGAADEQSEPAPAG